MGEQLVLESTPEHCTCEREREQTVVQHFEVAPAAGGGETAWDYALGRMLERFVGGPVHCVVITQVLTQRYAQLMIGHGRAMVEASSNEYLMGDFRLGAREELALERLGFEPPHPVEDDDQPLNWRRDEDPAEPLVLGHLVGTVLHHVMGFDPRIPVTIDVFGAESPCATCAWRWVP